MVLGIDELGSVTPRTFPPAPAGRPTAIGSNCCWGASDDLTGSPLSARALDALWRIRACLAIQIGGRGSVRPLHTASVCLRPPQRLHGGGCCPDGRTDAA